MINIALLAGLLSLATVSVPLVLINNDGGNNNYASAPTASTVPVSTRAINTVRDGDPAPFASRPPVVNNTKMEDPEAEPVITLDNVCEIYEKTFKQLELFLSNIATENPEVAKQSEDVKPLLRTDPAFDRIVRSVLRIIPWFEKIIIYATTGLDRVLWEEKKKKIRGMEMQHELELKTKEFNMDEFINAIKNITKKYAKDNDGEDIYDENDKINPKFKEKFYDPNYKSDPGKYDPGRATKTLKPLIPLIQKTLKPLIPLIKDNEKHLRENGHADLVDQMWAVLVNN